MFLIAALLFALTAMTYVEGASLHQDRGGSTVFARYAFNELVSFVAGWAILLDYVILIAVTAYSATQYLRVFWSPLGEQRRGARRSRSRSSRWSCSATSAASATRRARRVGILAGGRPRAAGASSSCSGWSLFFDPNTLLDPIHLGTAPTWSNLIFALTVAVIAFTSLESASGLSGEVRISRAGLKRLVWSTTGDRRRSSTWASRSSRSPRCPCTTATPALGDDYLERADDRHRRAGAPALARADADVPGRRRWRRSRCVAAANSAMLGLSRLAYSLSTNRQIPSGLGRLHPDALDALRADHPRRG